MLDIITFMGTAVHLCVIAVFFSLGRKEGFLREKIFEKAEYWGRIQILFVLLGTVLFISEMIIVKNYFSVLGDEMSSMSFMDGFALLFVLLAFVVLPYFIGYHSIPTKNMAILKNCAKNLARGRAIATGLGFFVAVIDGEKILLRTRTEKGSLFGKDLSGKWELPGGGMEIEDMAHVNYVAGNYYQPVFNTISREALEEVFLEIVQITDKRIIPAYLFKGDAIDLAHVAIVPISSIKRTPEFEELLLKGEVAFFSKEELENLNFVSPRMKFMAKEATSAI